MKNASLKLLFAISISLSAQLGINSNNYGQARGEGLDYGLIFESHGSMLNNKDDISAGSDLDFETKITSGVGANIGYYISQHYGFEVSVLYTKFSQGYVGGVSGVNSGTLSVGGDPVQYSRIIQNLAVLNKMSLINDRYSSSVNMNIIKIPFVFRFSGKNTSKVYFTSFIGPQLNLTTSVKLLFNGQSLSVSGYGVKARDLYEKFWLDWVAGVGVAVHLSKNVLADLHFRVDYNWGDIENKNLQVKITGPIFGTAYDRYYSRSRLPTHSGTAGVQIGIKYVIGDRMGYH